MGVHLRQAFDIVSYRVATPGVLGAMVVLGVAGIATRGGGLADYLSLAGGLAILVPLACWFVLIPGGRAHRADIERLLAGEAWAHWRYDEADWPWAVAARERGQRATIAISLVAAPIAAALALLGLAAPVGGAQAAFVPLGVPASDASVRDSQLHDETAVPDELWMGAESPKVYYVTGDCITLSGTVNGDHVIIDAAKREPRDGQIVIAQLNQGLTLKCFCRVGRGIELRPNAPGFEPILVGPEDELLIVGCLRKVYAKGDR